MKKKESASAAENYQFEVGAMYENMKGVYEVISIQHGSMVIRWKDGSEATTPMDLQKRIIDRMKQEEELRQLQAAKEQQKAQKKGKRESRKGTEG
ncbi:MAG: hypothetical protein M0036_18435 [Desulfobacteraceae bacterium]|nr:hypothetical protein [Desulfobacteraceae bacterium]